MQAGSATPANTSLSRALVIEAGLQGPRHQPTPPDENLESSNLALNVLGAKLQQGRKELERVAQGVGGGSQLETLGIVILLLHVFVLGLLGTGLVRILLGRLLCGF